MGAICLYGRNAHHEKRHLMNGYLLHNACGFNGEMDQLDQFHAKRCILEDLVHAVGWSSCECSASRIPLSLVCFVDCRLSTAHPVARCLVGHNSSEKAAAWPEGRLPAGWGGSCGDRSQRLVCSVAGVDPVDLRSHAHSWAAGRLGSRRWTSSVVPEEQGGGLSPAMTKSAIIVGSPRPNYGNDFTPLTTSARATIMKSMFPFVLTTFWNSLCWTTDGQCPLDIYLFLSVIGLIY